MRSRHQRDHSLPSTTRHRNDLSKRFASVFDALEPRRLLAAFSVDASAGVSATNFHTIADAIAAAAATSELDDTIAVAAGTYAEDVSITTPLTLTGAKAGVDPRAGRGSGESIVNGQIAIAASGVTVDGFTLLNGSTGASSPLVAGVFINAASATVTNTILTGNSGAGTGIALASTASAGSTTLSKNVVSNWSVAISVQSAGTTTIADSALTGNSVAGLAIDLLADAAASTVSVTNNALDNAGMAQIRLDGGSAGVDSVSLSNNLVTLRSGSLFVATTAPTPLSGQSNNSFTVVRAGVEDSPLAIDLSPVDATAVASINATGLAGTAVADGVSVNYTPPANFNGATSFSFVTTGGATGVVNLTVAPANDAPAGTAIPTQSVLEGSTKTVPLADYFSDVDAGDVLIFALANAPSFVAVDATTGVVTIAPLAGNVGSYSFDASASDGTSSSTQTITLSVVRGVNQTPVIGNLPASVAIAENTTGAVFDVDATDPDADDHLSYSISAGNGSGQFAIDPVTGAITLVSPLDAELAASYALTIRVTDDGDPSPTFAEGLLTVNVTDENDNATSVSLAGPTTGVEGQLLHYVATATDADIAAALQYRWFIDGVVQPAATSSSFDVTFTSEAHHVIKVEATDRSGTPAAATASQTIGDTAPTIPVSVSVPDVDEGTSFSITVGPITDPDPNDVMTIGQLAVDWGDDTFTVINSETDPATLALIRSGQAINVSHAYSDGRNQARPITVRVYDTNSHVYSAGASILVNNVAPTGTFAAITPTVAAGSNAFVNWFSTSDISPEDLTAGLRYTYAIDTNANGTLDPADTLIAGDGTYGGSVATSTATIPGALLNQTGAYSILGLLIDKDGTPILTRTVSLTVTPGTFRVVSLGGDHSGFTVNFNQVIDRTPLNLYDGNDAPVDLPDVVLTRANGQVVKGSLVINAAGTGFDFIVTGAILQAGTYTVLIRSGDTAFQAVGGADLDGDGNGAAGGNYTATFGVNAPPGPVLSMADFARGPGQSVDVNPSVTTSDLPVMINTPIAVSSLNFQIRYDASLLTVRPADAANGIADVYAGIGLPAGWNVAYTIGTNVINVSLTKTTPSAGNILGNKELLKIIATVPDDPAIYGKSEIFSFATIVVNGNASIEGTADRAIHKVVFLGDANLDGTVNAGDAALIESVVLNSVTGFDRYPLIDPTVLVDSSRNLAVDSQDSTNAALSGFTGGRPADVPAFDPVTVPLTLGADPTYSLPANFVATPGATISVPVSVTDDARGIQAGVLRISYDASKFTLAAAPVLAGSLLSAGWSILSNVNATEGYVEIAFYSGTALASSVPAVGTLVTLQFTVAANAADGVSPLTIAAPNTKATSPTVFFDRTGGLFATTAISGSIIIDTVAPTATPATFNYAGNGQSMTVTFSEDVRNSIAASDFELRNVVTDALVSLVISAISSDGKTVTLTFANTGAITPTMLLDGDYRFRVLAGQVTDIAGNPVASNVDSSFFFMEGDANHDRTVSFDDLLILAQHYGTPSGATFAEGDFNYDGAINFSDLLLLAQRYGTTLPAPLPQATSGTPKKRRVTDDPQPSVLR